MAYRKFRQDGPKAWSQWQALGERLTHFACCDCGLVHSIQVKEVAGSLVMRTRRHKARTKKRRVQIRHPFGPRSIDKVSIKVLGR